MSFSIKHLLGFVLIIGLGLGALINSNQPLIGSLARMVVWFALVLSAYGIWVSKAQTRAFRVGFLSWGGVYFLLNVVFNSEKTYFLDPLVGVLAPNMFVRDAQGIITQVDGAWLERFRLIGQCVLSIFAGIVGGWVTVYFYHKRQRMLAEEAIDKTG